MCYNFMTVFITVSCLWGVFSQIKDEIKSPLKSSIQSDYMGFNGTNIVSLGWNFVHRQVESVLPNHDHTTDK